MSGALRKVGVVICAGALTCGVEPVAQGASTSWTGATGSGVWSDSGNWTSGVPVDGMDLLFGANGSPSTRDNISSLEIGTITFETGAPA